MVGLVASVVDTVRVHRADAGVRERARWVRHRRAPAGQDWLPDR